MSLRYFQIFSFNSPSFHLSYPTPSLIPSSLTMLVNFYFQLNSTWVTQEERTSAEELSSSDWAGSLSVGGMAWLMIDMRVQPTVVVILSVSLSHLRTTVRQQQKKCGERSTCVQLTAVLGMAQLTPQPIGINGCSFNRHHKLAVWSTLNLSVKKVYFMSF